MYYLGIGAVVALTLLLVSGVFRKSSKLNWNEIKEKVR